MALATTRRSPAGWPALTGGLEYGELADEATGQRDPCEGEQKQRENQADKRIAPAQARPAGQVICSPPSRSRTTPTTAKAPTVLNP